MIKSIIKSCLAFGMAFFIANAACFFYFNPMHNTELNDYRLEPETFGIYAVEGFGMLYSDKNGFPNREAELAEKDYILVMGSSHSAGDQVLRGYRYSDLLDNKYNQDGKIHVYNVAHGGKRFQHIIKNFKDITTEFPDSKAVIIEVSEGTIMMSDEEFQDAMSQVEYENSVHGSELKNHTCGGRIIMGIKKYCPLALLIYDQLTRKSFTNIHGAFMHASAERMNAEYDGQETISKSEDIYKQYFQSLNLLRSEYSGKIVVMYHEPFTINELHNEKCDNSLRAEYLKEACKMNNIIFINMKQDFMDAYLHDYSISHGFYNTEMINGHLNKTGHRIIAEKLYIELQKSGN